MRSFYANMTSVVSPTDASSLRQISPKREPDHALYRPESIASCFGVRVVRERSPGASYRYIHGGDHLANQHRLRGAECRSRASGRYDQQQLRVRGMDRLWRGKRLSLSRGRDSVLSPPTPPPTAPTH